jgi:hypothetical protein
VGVGMGFVSARFVLGFGWAGEMDGWMGAAAGGVCVFVVFG